MNTAHSSRRQVFRAGNILIAFNCLMFLACTGCHTDDDNSIMAVGGHLEDVVGTGFAGEDVVYLDSPKIDDYAFARAYPALRHLGVAYLTIEHAPVTDCSIPMLRELSTLKDLSIWDTKLTIDGVRKLHGMPSLTHLKLGPEWTSAEVNELRKDLPGVKVERDPD